MDRYVSDLFTPHDNALEEALRSSVAADLPPIQVSSAQGKMLHLLARAVGARRILELGTLGGYSTIWLARALPPGGRLVTLEVNPKCAQVAAQNLARAGLSEVVEVRLGPAIESLPQLVSENGAPFDLIFIDADKPNYPEYFPWVLRLSRVGTVILADNVVRNGAVADSGSADPLVQGVRRFNELVAAEPRVSATVVQTVGGKGYDGFPMAMVVAGPGNA